MINVNKELLEKSLQKTKEKDNEILKNMNKTKFPRGLAELVITKVEALTFKTKNDPEVHKIKVFFNMADPATRGKFYDVSEDFPFFISKDKETGEDMSYSVNFLYALIDSAFGKKIIFKSGEMASIVDTFMKALTYFKEKQIPFHSIVLHKDEVYKDRIVPFARLFRSSIRAKGQDISDLKKMQDSMNLHWSVSKKDKQRAMAMKKTESLTTAHTEAGIPAEVDNFTVNLNSLELATSKKDDDVPF